MAFTYIVYGLVNSTTVLPVLVENLIYNHIPNNSENQHLCLCEYSM